MEKLGAVRDVAGGSSACGRAGRVSFDEGYSTKSTWADCPKSVCVFGEWSRCDGGLGSHV